MVQKFNRGRIDTLDLETPATLPAMAIGALDHLQSYVLLLEWSKVRVNLPNDGLELLSGLQDVGNRVAVCLIHRNTLREVAIRCFINGYWKRNQLKTGAKHKS